MKRINQLTDPLKSSIEHYDAKLKILAWTGCLYVQPHKTQMMSDDYAKCFVSELDANSQLRRFNFLWKWHFSPLFKILVWLLKQLFPAGSQVQISQWMTFDCFPSIRTKIHIFFKLLKKQPWVQTCSLIWT